MMRVVSLIAPGAGWLWLAWLLLCPAVVQAQVKVQVVTRTVEQTLACPRNTVVRIRADKATLRVQAWDKPVVQVVMRLIARHPERAVAEKDLPAARYQIVRSDAAIDLVNYFAVPAGAPPLRSDLRAEYTVQMPADNTLEVVNAYGQTFLTGLGGRQHLEQDFGQVTLQDLRGSLLATTRFADITATNTNMALSCTADKSAVHLTGAAGNYAIRNRYGTVVLEPTAELRSATIEAERTEVKIGVPQLGQFNYDLSASQGQLHVPSSLQSAVRKLLGRSTLRTNAPGRLPLIRVESSLAPLSLQTLPLLMQR